MTEPAAEARGFAISAAHLRWGLVVVLAFAALHAPPLAARFERNSWLYADGSFYFTSVKAMAEHGRLEQRDLQPTSWYEQDLGWNRELDPAWSNVSIGREGRWYPKHPILLPVLAVPFYWLFGPPGTLVLNVLLNVVFVLLVFLLCTRVARPGVAAVTAVLVAAQQIVISSSYSFSNDVLGGVLLVGSLDATLGRRFRLAGILAGFSIWSRVTHLVFVPALMLVAWSEAGVAGMLAGARWSLLPLGIFALHNWWLFGAPWNVSYQRVLSRTRGEAQVVAVANNFHVAFQEGLRRIVSGKDGAFASFPLLAPGLLGLLALPRRRLVLGLGVGLFCVPYLLVLAKYDWFRPQFLYPVFGASALGLAAIGERLLGAAPEPAVEVVRVPRLAWVIATIVVLVAAIAVRVTIHRDPSLLSSRLEEARVFLRDTPCDYFNPQNERWECSHFDRGEGWMMTGRILGDPVRVRRAVRPGIWMHPHASGDWRRLVFDTLPPGRLELDFALGDATRPGAVDVELRVRGREAETFALSRAGQEEHRSVVVADGDGPALEVRVKSADASWKHLVWDGRLLPP